MPQSILIKPVSLPEDLNAAEWKFARCMAEGKECIISMTRPTPAEVIDKGENANVVRAEVIRFFACGGSEDNPVVGNTISLSGVHISGILNLLLVSSPYALALMDCRFDAPVNMLHAKFRALNLSGSCLPHGLRGGGMHIDGSIFMRDKFFARGGVSLTGANVGGDVDCHGSRFINKNDKSLVADRIKVGGDFFMHKNFVAKGGVSLLGANVGGNVVCNNGKFKNKEGSAFSADTIKVGGILSMQDNFAAEGEVSLHGANIGGDMYCINSEFNNEKGYALIIDRTKVSGNFLLQDNFVAKGEVSLSYADISGNLGCSDSKFMKGFSAEAIKVGNSLRWQNIEGNGIVDLSFAIADVFDYDEKSLHGFEFILDGFSYKRFAEHKSVESQLNWLRNCPAEKLFSPQPFEHAAKVLFAMGYNNDARRILLEKERLLTDKGQFGKWHRRLRRCWNFLAGYGYEWWRTLIAAAIFVGVGAVLFDFANRECRIVPHQPVVMTLDKYTPLQDGDKCTADNRPTEVMGREFSDYPRFHALIYSADVFIPAFALHLESHWYPQPKENDTDLALVILRVWYWIEIIAGWILTSVFVLTITGLLKPRQSSLE